MLILTYWHIIFDSKIQCMYILYAYLSAINVIKGCGMAMSLKGVAWQCHLRVWHGNVIKGCGMAMSLKGVAWQEPSSLFAPHPTYWVSAILALSGAID